jgi:hypothetical protein
MIAFAEPDESEHRGGSGERYVIRVALVAEACRLDWFRRVTFTPHHECATASSLALGVLTFVPCGRQA